MSTIDDFDPDSAWLEQPSLFGPIGPAAGERSSRRLEDGAAVDDGGDRWVSAETLATLAPDGDFLAELEKVNLAEVDEYYLVEMAAGYQRLAAWIDAKLTHVAGVLARRPLMHGRGALPSHVGVGNMAADELAPRLGLSRFAAQRIVRNAQAFAGTFALTGHALAIGHVDVRKASTIVSMLEDYPGEVAVLVQDAVIDEAGTQTHSQLVAAIRKAVIAAGHDDADVFHAKARAKRRVDHPRQLPDGMASIRAVLPATDAVAFDLALDAAARSARAGGDQRTLDQLRADVMALMGHAALETGYVGLPPGTIAGAKVPDESAADTEGSHHSTPDDEPPPSQAVPAAGAAELPSAPTIPPPPSEARSPQPPGPVSAEPTGSSADRPADPAPPPRPPEGTGASTASPHRPSPTTDEPDPPGSPPPELSGCPPRRWHMPVGEVGGRRAQISVLVPLSVMLPPDIARQLGLPASGPADGSGAQLVPLPDEDAMVAFLERDPAEVAELEGYGPISPAVARAAALGGTWRRIVTDPLSGIVLDHGRARYRPPADLAELVRLRDGTCVRAGCTHPARSCQIDHVVPWSAGGTTCLLDLDDLCTHDHVLKTSGEFQLHRLGAGEFEWITPSGHTYRRHRGGRVTRQHRSAHSFADNPAF